MKPASPAPAEATTPIKPLKWSFTNGFGERDRTKVTEQDVLSSIAFDQTGDYISVGDKGGRVIIFKKISAAKSAKKPVDYTYFTEFQSHESEFDELKSIEIEEKINKIEWINRYYKGLFVLATNDKKIKLWKIYNKEDKKAYGLNLESGTKGVKALKIPKIKKAGNKMVTNQLKKTFQNAHDFHINSLSLCADNEHFLSADDLRVNIWNLNISNEVYSVVDIPVENMEDLSEVITSASFHPTDPNMFLFSSSKGVIKMCDFRMNSQYDRCAMDYSLPEESQKKNFFSEIINSISYACFAKTGNYIFSRDYITVKAWDIRKNRTPLSNLRLCAYLERKLCDLYESENIFDKFELCSSPDSSYMLTGSYSDSFHIVDRQGNCAVTLSAIFDNPKGAPIGTYHYDVDKKPPTLPSFDFSRKIQQAVWHPSSNTAAVSNYNCLFVFNGQPA